MTASMSFLLTMLLYTLKKPDSKFAQDTTANLRLSTLPKGAVFVLPVIEGMPLYLKL